MSNSLDRTLISSHAALGHEAVHAALLEPGVKVAQRYEIEALLGEGGIGAVYRARDLELDEVIALKTLRAEISSDPAAIERFRREVKLARKVTHPNVARTFDLGSCEGFRFITMELIEGGSLARRVEAGAMSLSDALRVCGDIARGLRGRILVTDSSITGMNGFWARLRELDADASPMVQWSLRTPDQTFAYRGRADAVRRYLGLAPPGA